MYQQTSNYYCNCYFFGGNYIIIIILHCYSTFYLINN